MDNNTVFMIYLLVPVILILAMIFVSVYFRSKNEENIADEVFSLFTDIWKSDAKKAEDGEESFDQLFLRLFNKTYAYQGYQASSNKTKLFLYKALVLLLIGSVPFLMVSLVTKKSVILGDTEWNDIYLYVVIAVPVIFAFLLNQFISIGQYRGMWIQHAKIKDHMEWRMMELIKDYEMKRAGMNKKESYELLASLKRDFMDDMCAYWDTSTSEIAEKILSKDESLFQEIAKLLNK